MFRPDNCALVTFKSIRIGFEHALSWKAHYSSPPGAKHLLKVAPGPAVVRPLRGSLLLKHLDRGVVEPHHARMHRQQSPEAQAERQVHHKRYHRQRKPVRSAENTPLIPLMISDSETISTLPTPWKASHGRLLTYFSLLLLQRRRI